jgi:Vanadium chloroperoxidase N-terminal domain
MVQIGVADTGQGIPDEELDKIFGRFYRGEKSRSRLELRKEQMMVEGLIQTSEKPNFLRAHDVSSGFGLPMDPIIYWNEVALEANRVSHTNGKNEQTGPTLSSRALGIVHLAMYDAFAGISGNPPDLPPICLACPRPCQEPQPTRP